jgi:DNA modification methylase
MVKTKMKQKENIENINFDLNNKKSNKIEESIIKKELKNNIYHGDCKEYLEILKEQNIGIDLTITSPPYYNVKDYVEYEDLNDYMKEMKIIFTKIYEITNESKICIVNISPILISRENRSKESRRIPLPFYFVVMMEKIGFQFLEDIIWEKPSGSVSNRNGVFYRHRKPLAYKPNIVTEYILVFKKPSSKILDKYLKKDSLVEEEYEKTNIWKMNPKTKSGHPAPFPIELPEKCIKYYSYENDNVLDPFMGSGTTAVASKKLKRNYFGSELHKEYIELSEKRLKEI